MRGGEEERGGERRREQKRAGDSRRGKGRERERKGELLQQKLQNVLLLLGFILIY